MTTAFAHALLDASAADWSRAAAAALHREAPAEETADRAVRAALHRLPTPRDAREADRLLCLAEILAEGDGHAAAVLLDDPVSGPGRAFLRLPCYAAVALAAEIRAAHGLDLPGIGPALRLIRHQVRAELLRLPLALSTGWVVAATAEDQTAAHVAALIFARTATICRPWIWPGLPGHGRFVLVGRAAREDAAARHPRCDGAFAFAHVALRLPPG